MEPAVKNASKKRVPCHCPKKSSKRKNPNDAESAGELLRIKAIDVWIKEMLKSPIPIEINGFEKASEQQELKLYEKNILIAWKEEPENRFVFQRVSREFSEINTKTKEVL